MKDFSHLLKLPTVEEIRAELRNYRPVDRNCGKCRYFANKDADGYGYCSLLRNTEMHSSQKCIQFEHCKEGGGR